MLPNTFPDVLLPEIKKLTVLKCIFHSIYTKRKLTIAFLTETLLFKVINNIKKMLLLVTDPVTNKESDQNLYQVKLNVDINTFAKLLQILRQEFLEVS